MNATPPAVHSAVDQLPVEPHELGVLERILPLDRQQIIELGCGNARFLRGLLQAHPNCQAVALEVDTQQHAKNLARPQAGLRFLEASAEHIPFDAATFDLALMLKSLHHVPLPAMDAALAEVARVLRPGGLLYVSEPIYDGALNEVVRCYNDEGEVRAAAQAALDRALNNTDHWQAAGEHRFNQTVRFQDFDEFEQRMMRPTFVDLSISEAQRAQVQHAFERFATPAGAHFVRPMHVRVLRRR